VIQLTGADHVWPAPVDVWPGTDAAWPAPFDLMPILSTRDSCQAPCTIPLGFLDRDAVGVVANAHPNVRWNEYDCLKAILYNCVRHGPASQNRACEACSGEFAGTRNEEP